MTNAENCCCFKDIAARLKVKKDNIFKIRAYENAAAYIMDWPTSIEELARESA